MFSLEFKCSIGTAQSKQVQKATPKNTMEFQNRFSEDEALKKALMDIQVLIATNGAVSCVDRIHTVLHSYLMNVCKKENIAFSQDMSLMKLFKLVCNKHPALNFSNPKNQTFRRILGNIDAIISDINKSRNRFSLAHPNELLLEAEAQFVIDLVKTLIDYFEHKFNEGQTAMVDKKCINCQYLP